MLWIHAVPNAAGVVDHQAIWDGTDEMGVAPAMGTLFVFGVKTGISSPVHVTGP
jgi:hypothetical protein